MSAIANGPIGLRRLVVERVLEALSAVANLPPAAPRHQRHSYLDPRAREAHTPRPYDGRVILYRATERAPHTVRDPDYERADDDLGWAELCPDLEVVRNPATTCHCSTRRMPMPSPTT